MKSPAVVHVCLVIGYILTADALKCQSPQYVIIGERGKVECEFPQQFTGIVWYDSTNTSEALVTRLEKQENEALKVSGNGYDSGYYDMFPNGSLIIPTVSVYHDRTFKVVLIDEAFKVENADILIITIVYPSQSTPLIESCGPEGLCLVSPKEIDFLQCKYNHARPPVSLSWYQNHEGGNWIVDAQLTKTNDGQYTFESILTVNVSGLVQDSLNIFTCEASGPALDFKETKTTVLSFDFDQEKTRQSKTNKSVTVQNVGLHNQLEIFCKHSKPIAFVWTFERHNTSSIIAIFAKGQKKIMNTLNDTFDVLPDGTITFSKTSYHLEGIYTCTYLESNTSSFRTVQIKIGNYARKHKTVAWTTPVIVAGLIVAIVGGLVSTTYYVYKTMWIHLIPSTLDGVMTCCEKIAEYILSWPLYNTKNDFVFNKDGIELLRTVSDEIESNRHNKNVGVISGSATSIAGAAITFAGAGLLPITFGGSSVLMGLGAVIGATGAAISVGSSVLQMMSDTNKRDKVQPALESFLGFQKDLAVTINNLAIVFNVIIKKRELRQICKQTAVSRSVIIQLREIFERLKAGHPSCVLNEKLTLASKCTTEMLQILEKGITNTPFNETFSLRGENLAEQIRKAQEHSFESLPSSIKTVVQTTRIERGKPTVLTLVIMSFADSSEKNGDVRNAPFRQENEGTKAVAGKGVDGALNLASRGVLVGNRLILKTLDLSDDAIRLTTNVTKMAKAVTVAGIILGAVGVVVDVVFLGHAVYDLLRKERGESAQALSDIANVMEEINHLSHRKSKIVSKKV